MKIDPHKHKEKYLAWKEKVDNSGCIPGISSTNSELTLKYLSDMELGINISSASVKGSRSFIRLNTLRQRMIFLSRKFEEHYNLDNITHLTEDQIITFFAKIKNRF